MLGDTSGAGSTHAVVPGRLVRGEGEEEKWNRVGADKAAMADEPVVTQSTKRGVRQLLYAVLSRQIKRWATENGCNTIVRAYTPYM